MVFILLNQGTALVNPWHLTATRSYSEWNSMMNSYGHIYGISASNRNYVFSFGRSSMASYQLSTHCDLDIWKSLPFVRFVILKLKPYHICSSLVRLPSNFPSELDVHSSPMLNSIQQFTGDEHCNLIQQE
ncbi:hypothetical protein LINGRAHAP2_LOCUS23292 [Linum grandiflorum]